MDLMLLGHFLRRLACEQQNLGFCTDFCLSPLEDVVAVPRLDWCYSFWSIIGLMRWNTIAARLALAWNAGVIVFDFLLSCLFGVLRSSFVR